jgi:hypothetical protein
MKNGLVPSGHTMYMNFVEKKKIFANDQIAKIEKASHNGWPRHSSPRKIPGTHLC